MAAYGKGQMLGSGINPESFKLDFGGFADAARMQAQGLSNLGQSIGGAIQNYNEVKQERKKIDADTKASRAGIESAIKLGDSLGFDVKSMLSPVLEKMDDPNTTPMEAAALGREASSQIANVLNLGFKAKDQKSQQDSLMQDAAYKKAQLEIAQQNANSRALSAIAAGNAPPANIDMPLGDGSTKLMQWDGARQSYVPVRTSGLDGTTQTAKGDDLISLVKGFEGFEPKAYNDYKQTSVGYGTKGKPGEVLTEEQASERLQSELSGHAKRIKDAAALKGITLNKNQFNALTSFDFNTGRGANLIERFGDDPQQLASKILEYNKAGGEVKGGLVKRRQIEAALFLSPEQQAAESPQVTPQNQGGIGFTPAKTSAGEEGTVMTQQELDNLVERGESIESQPLGGGKYFVKTSRLNNKLSRPELRLKYLEDAATAYAAGDKPRALRLATAAEVGGLFGNLTISDLDDYFVSGAAPAASDPVAPAPVTPTPVAPVAPKIKEPLESIFSIKK
jgi:GH24 family phage-related lysozyme (muramidase)